MRADPAVRPVPAARRLRRALAGTLLAAAVLLGALAGWSSAPRPGAGPLAATAAQLLAAPGRQAPPRQDDSWRSGGRPDAVLAWSRDRPAPNSPLPNDRTGTIRSGWALLLLLFALGRATAGRGGPRAALVGLSPSRGPPAAA
jgi:hypothetical protein